MTDAEEIMAAAALSAAARGAAAGRAAEQREAARGARWAKGQSGNPAGRPKGSRNRATLMAEALMDGEAQKLTRIALEMALDGDAVALRFCLARLVPVRRDRPVEIELPLPPEGEIVTAAETEAALGAIIRAVVEGQLAPAEGALVAGLVERRARAAEAVRQGGRDDAAKIEAETEAAPRPAALAAPVFRPVFSGARPRPGSCHPRPSDVAANGIPAAAQSKESAPCRSPVMTL
jgi:uncharacterized protein DUF5681